MANDEPLARFKDLCIDANDPTVAGGFWSAVLALSPDSAGRRNLKLLGGQPEQTIWVNWVRDPKTAKHRVHLDVEVGDISGLRGLGAQIVREPNDEDPWWVMQDPEGGEFCAFIRDGRSALPGRFYEVVVDSTDPHRQREWWGRVFAMPAKEEPARDHAALISAGRAPFDFLCFVPVPEPKTVKNRVHWDVTTPDVDALIAHGATVLREPDNEINWHVLADPEGNEFCAFA
jgi:hypothetical protein